MKNKILFYAFFVLLMAPVLTFPFFKGKIDSENHEKREFAEMPKLSLGTVTAFPEGFDAYFNDRLPYKNQLVFLNNLKNTVLREGTTPFEYLSKTVAIRGKDGWLFYNAAGEGEESMKDYLCENLYEEEELAQIAGRYTMLQEKLKEMGIELVVLYAANKEQVYPEYMPSGIVPTGDVSRTDQLYGYIREHTDVPLLYTKDALLKEKRNHQVFYKYDTHWNGLGGFVGAQVLNEYFHGEYVSLDDVSYFAVRNNKSGDLADLLSMRALYHDDTEWEVDGYKPEVTVTETEDDDFNLYTSNAGDDRSVLVILDSFGYALRGLAKDFSKVALAKGTDKFKEYCETMKPDIVLVEIVERRKKAQEEWCGGLYDLLIEE